MDKLRKSLEELQKYFKMAIKPPKVGGIDMPSMPKVTDAPKAVSAAPKSKKDPAKVAEQIKNGKSQNNPFKPPAISFTKSGQWTLK